MGPMLRSLALCGLLAACGGTYEWTKAGMTPATRDADLMACGTRNAHLEKDDPAAVTVIDRCMAERGYQKTAR